MAENIQEPVIQLKLEQGTVFSFGRRYWKVLEIDDTAHTLLVQSRFSIGIHAYHEKYCEITWETCSLRKWLNTVFLQEEFNEQYGDVKNPAEGVSFEAVSETAQVNSASAE